jgi:hypothetical protein
MQQLMQLAHRQASAQPDLAMPVDLSQVRNAHRTNTPDEMREALAGRYNMFEGDVRLDRHGQPVLAHGRTDERGLPLDQWLELARESGRSVKLEFKETRAIGPAMLALHASGVDADKVMLNVTCVTWPGLDKLDPDEIAELAQQNPQMRIALSIGRVPYTDRTLHKAAQAARAVGDPNRVTFPLQSDHIDEHVIAQLAPYGSISAWNHPAFFDPDDLEAERSRLQDLGVNGMIDLRHDGQGLGPEMPSPRPQLSALSETAERARDDFEDLQQRLGF